MEAVITDLNWLRFIFKIARMTGTAFALCLWILWVRVTMEIFYSKCVYIVQLNNLLLQSEQV